MKARFITVLAIAAALTSCKKIESNTTGPQVKLAATTFYKDGSEETRRDRSGAFGAASYSRLVNDGQSEKFLVNLGAAATGNTLPEFGISFIFNQQTTPQGIAGSYSFPRDYAKVYVTLRNEVTQTVTETLFFPTRGSVSFLYDSTARQVSGHIDNLEFSIIPNDPYNRYRVTIDGSFAAVPVTQ